MVSLQLYRTETIRAIKEKFWLGHGVVATYVAYNVEGETTVFWLGHGVVATQLPHKEPPMLPKVLAWAWCRCNRAELVRAGG